MTSFKWAGTTAIALIAVVLVLRLLVYLLTPIAPWLVALLLMAAIFGLLVRGR